ncbi:MAG TPA: MBL fold metallo-hydrolase [Burkholderiales bacterium]|nr:MBL fold metallo-hydrolase [Burkholderiales bacterium]
MVDIAQVDALEVLVLVDNVTDSLSSNPRDVLPEWSVLLTGGKLRVLAGSTICCAHHGLSLLLTAYVGGRKRTLLFDAGPAAATFQRNTEILGVDFASVEAVVLSHGHWDHAGGLLSAVESIARSRGGNSFACYVHPGMFRQRATKRPDGQLYVNELVPDPERLSAAGAKVLSTREPQSVADGAFYLSGEIPRVTSYEAGVPNHLTRSADGASWEPDPLIMDERFVSVHVRNKGQFVFSACSHAGLINVLTHARSVFPAVPLYGAMGGLHLSGINERVIPQTVADLKKFGLKLLAPGHCTGWRAVSQMAREFGDELVPSAVGKKYLI